MIKIEIDLMVALYLVISIIILIIWIFSERKSSAYFSGKDDSVWQCPICFHSYIDSCSENISRCPKCKTLHKKREKE